MGGRSRILACLIAGVVSLAPVAPALASGGGTTTSAGDQQYVDPLANTNSQTSTTPPLTATASPPPTSTSPSPSPSAPAAVATAPAPAATATGAPAQTLPFTGLNVGTLVALGLGLLTGGVALRYLARRAPRR